MKEQVFAKSNRKLNNLPFIIERFSTSQDTPEISNDYITITFITNGTTIVNVAHIAFNAHAGAVYVVSNNVPLSFANSVDLEGYNITFDISVIENYNPEIKNLSGYINMVALSSLPSMQEPVYSTLVTDGPCFSQLKAIAEVMEQEYTNADSCSESAITGLLYSFVLVLSRQYEYCRKRRGSADAIIHHTYELLQRNIQNKISVGDIARSCNVSEQHLRRIYKKVSSVSPMHTLMELRILKAQYLLVSTTYTLAKIAAECGFYDASHMKKYFKKSCGISPAEYRIQNKKT